MLTDIDPKDQTTQFLEHVFSEIPEGRWFHVWTLPDKLSQRLNSPAEAAGFVSQQHNGHDVYVGIALAVSAGKASKRVRVRDAAGIVAFVADVDFQNDGHVGRKDYPPDLEAARAVIDGFPLSPTVLVHSRHGLQAWWVFREPWLFATSSERAKAQRLAAAWGKTLQWHAKRSGYGIDSVHDLARVMRVPGTCNNKTTRVPVRILALGDSRYNPPFDFEEHLTRTELLTSATAALDAQFPLTLDSGASPPQKKSAALLANDGRFAATWEHKRDNELGDASMSGYDMALATAAAQADWSDCDTPLIQEDRLEELLGKLVQRVHIDDATIEWVIATLKESHRDEKAYHDSQISRLQTEVRKLQGRLDAAYEDKLDGNPPRSSGSEEVRNGVRVSLSSREASRVTKTRISYIWMPGSRCYACPSKPAHCGFHSLKPKEESC